MQWKLWKTCWVFNPQVLHLAEEKDRGAWARVASRETLSSQNTLEEKESVITALLDNNTLYLKDSVQKNGIKGISTYRINLNLSLFAQHQMPSCR